MVEELLVLWLSRFPPMQEAELITSIRRYAQIYGPTLPMGTACSGTDIVSKSDRDICNVLNHKYGLSLFTKQVLACEWDKKKQKVLLQENPDVDLLIPDLEHMKNQRVPNVLAGPHDPHCLVPQMHGFRTGS